MDVQVAILYDPVRLSDFDVSPVQILGNARLSDGFARDVARERNNLRQEIADSISDFYQRITRFSDRFSSRDPVDRGFGCVIDSSEEVARLDTKLACGTRFGGAAIKETEFGVMKRGGDHEIWIKIIIVGAPKDAVQLIKQIAMSFAIDGIGLKCGFGPDTPKLIWADWLEEQDELELAEAIRQICGKA